MRRNVVDQTALNTIHAGVPSITSISGPATLPEIAAKKRHHQAARSLAVSPQQDAALEVKRRKPARHHAPILAYGQQWQVGKRPSYGSMQDDAGAA